MDKPSHALSDRQSRKPFSMATWARKNLAPYWGLWLVAVATLIAFAAVVVWFAR